MLYHMLFIMRSCYEEYCDHYMCEEKVIARYRTHALYETHEHMPCIILYVHCMH